MYRRNFFEYIASDFYNAMSIISLITDFGTEDEYAGIMKGVIYTVNPSARIVDITHNLEPQGIIQAAYVIASSYHYFPPGTVHIIVVDPGVGSNRAIIALEKNDHVFLAPDNGVLTLILKDDHIGAVIRVENSDFFLNPVSRTFHGRDIFAPVGAHISKGLNIKKLGPPLSRDKIKQIDIPVPKILSKYAVMGNIISIDRFGNLITNISLHDIENILKTSSANKIEIIAGKTRISGLSMNYASVRPQQQLAVIGSRGYLEIAVNRGNAKYILGAQKGESVKVRTVKPE